MNPAGVTPDDLARHAEAVARAAGMHARTSAHRRDEVNFRSHHDVKLQLDVETQQVAYDCIRKAYPDHGFLGEEGEDEAATHAVCWIVDPIDGTMNFFQGLPLWCTSIAVQVGGRTVAGAVYAPEQDECFTVTIDGPTLCNGSPVRVSDTPDLRQSMICTAGLSRVSGDPGPRLPGFVNLLNEASKVRVLGAAALDLCYVACGRLDGMYEYGLKIWDVAAGGLMVLRAGGTFERFDSAGGYVATNGRIRDELRRVLNLEDPDESA